MTAKILAKSPKFFTYEAARSFIFENWDRIEEELRKEYNFYFNESTAGKGAKITKIELKGTFGEGSKRIRDRRMKVLITSETSERYVLVHLHYYKRNPKRIAISQLSQLSSQKTTKGDLASMIFTREELLGKEVPRQHLYKGHIVANARVSLNTERLAGSEEEFRRNLRSAVQKECWDTSPFRIVSVDPASIEITLVEKV